MVRLWNPPTFDAEGNPVGSGTGLPTVQDLESIRSGVQKSAHEQGRQDGYAKGIAEGYAAGFDQGREEGRAQACKEAMERMAPLEMALGAALAVLRDLPDSVGPSLSELAFEIGSRLAGRDDLERAPFLAAVQEALMRLPRPGETLLLRLAPSDVEVWQGLLQGAGLPFGCELVADVAVTPGHAFVEVDGARINVGSLARRALVRMALGLPLSETEPGNGGGD